MPPKSQPNASTSLLQQLRDRQAMLPDAQGQVVVAGGRVLCVTALADSVSQARERAYATLASIHFDGMQHRQDIGHRAL